MINLKNWGRHSHETLYVNLYLGLHGWKYRFNPPVRYLSYRLFQSAKVNGEH